MSAFNVLRSVGLSALLAFGVFAVEGCAAETNEVSENDVTQGDTDLSLQNGWVYTAVDWVESMNDRATGQTPNFSESYFVYWNAFEEYCGANRRLGLQRAISVMHQYGLVAQKDFVPATSIKAALATLRQMFPNGMSCKGVFGVKREDMRAVLDKAFGLSPQQIALLDQVFGRGVERTLEAYKEENTGTAILRPKDIPVALPNPNTHAMETKTLDQTFGVGWLGYSDAMTEVVVDYYDGVDRKLETRIQRAVADGAPVLIAWLADLNAVSAGRTFGDVELHSKGNGSQDGVLSLVTDVDVILADNTHLEADKTSYTPEQQKQALDPSAKVQFFRVKNTILPQAGKTLDLRQSYLNGKMTQCPQVNGTSDTSGEHGACGATRGLWSVYLPKGY